MVLEKRTDGKVGRTRSKSVKGRSISQQAADQMEIRRRWRVLALKIKIRGSVWTGAECDRIAWARKVP